MVGFGWVTGVRSSPSEPEAQSSRSQGLSNAKPTPQPHLEILYVTPGSFRHPKTGGAPSDAPHYSHLPV